MIYFAQPTNGGPIRIGCTENVDRRLVALGSWVCGGVEIIATIEGEFYRERILLEMFAPINVDKDWFKSCPAMWQFIIDSALPQKLDWLPLNKDTGGYEFRCKQIFGDLENAARELGYTHFPSFKAAMNAVNSSAHQFAAKLTLAEMIWWRVLPDYVDELHQGSYAHKNRK